MLVAKNLMRRRVRSALSVLGISIGIAAIVAFNAIGQGFKRSLDRYMSESGAQVLVLNRTVQDPQFSRVKPAEQDFVRARPEVEHLSRGTFTIASPRGLKVKAGMPALLVFGRDPGDRLVRKFQKDIQGRVFEAEDEAMVGIVAARNLGLETGGILDLFGRRFRVVGIYDSGVSFETVGVVIANRVVQAHQNMGESINMGFVYLRDGADWTRLRAAVEAAYPDLTVIRTEEFTGFYNQLEYIDWFVWVISLVSVAVGGLGVLNTMLMSVSERTREIGTLRAVGWSRGMVLRLILAEGTAISALGGAIGLGLGWAGAETILKFAPAGFLATSYPAQLWPIAFGVAVVLGFLGALYPAWQASRLSPIEALKYE